MDNLQRDAESMLNEIENEQDNTVVSKGAVKILNLILKDTNTLNTDLVK